MKLAKTSKFYVFDAQGLGSDHCSDNHSKDISVYGLPDDLQSIESMRQVLSKYGCCSRKGVLSDEGLQSLRSILNPFIRYLTNNYDFYEDEFVDIDFDEYGIVRLPRIGVGKLSMFALHNKRADMFINSIRKT